MKEISVISVNNLCLMNSKEVFFADYATKCAVSNANTTMYSTVKNASTITAWSAVGLKRCWSVTCIGISETIYNNTEIIQLIILIS